MNFDNLVIWLKCFWAVICPNWWTLALFVAAAAAFGIMKLVYGNRPIKDRNALQQVGRRWRLVGYIVLAAAVAIYIVELVVMYVGTAKVLGNKETPTEGEIVLALNKTQYDLVRFREKNKNRMKTTAARAKVEKEFVMAPSITLAEKSQLELARKFSDNLAKTSNRRFYPYPAFLPDKDDKAKALRLISDDLKNQKGDVKKRDDDVIKAARMEYTPEERREALKKLEAKLTDPENKIHRLFSNVERVRSDKEKAEDVLKGGLRKDNDFSTESYKRTVNYAVRAIFAEKIQPDNPKSETFDKFLAPVCGSLVIAYGTHIDNMFTDANLDKISNSIKEAVRNDPGYEENKENINWLCDKYDHYLRLTLNKDWLERIKNVVRTELARRDTEELLFNNDLLSYTTMTVEEKSLNDSLRSLYVSAVWVHDLFWCVVIAIIALVVFTLRGGKLVRMGNPRTVRNKIHNA